MQQGDQEIKRDQQEDQKIKRTDSTFSNLILLIF